MREPAILETPEQGASLPLPPRSISKARLLALGVGAAVALLGAAAMAAARLFGGAWSVRSSSYFPVSAETAVCLVIAGLGLLAAVYGNGELVKKSDAGEIPGSAAIKRLGQLAGVVVVALGALALFSRGPTALLASGSEPRQMAIGAAVYFIITGTALLLIDVQGVGLGQTQGRRWYPSEWLACAAAWLALLAFTGTLLQVPRVYHVDSTVTIGLHASAAMMALALGLLAARPQRGLAAVIISSTVGGTMLRRLAPATLLVPPLGMWALIELAPRLGIFDARFGIALGTMAGCAIIATLEAVVATRLATVDSERMENQATLRRALSDLGNALRERDRTRRDLERSNRDLDEFAYAASHDLRAPLRGIASLAQWIEEDLGSSVGTSTQQQLELMRGRIRRMETLIDDILNYSRAGRSSEPLREVATAELLRETIEMVAPPPGAVIEIADDMPQILTERAQLQQVLMNLLSNAIKHARRSDPYVKISADDQGEFIRFEVADNGPGVPKQYQDRIWGMFQTLASRDKVEGSGIGLATVKKLVERQGGRVGVDSAEGKGARFFFFWPKHNGT